MLLATSMVLMMGAGIGMFLMLGTSEAPSEASVQAQAPAEPAVVQEVATPPAPTEPAPAAAAGEPAPLELPEAKLGEDVPRTPKRADVWAALNKKHGLSPKEEGDPAPSEASASLLPTLDAKYIREAVGEQLVPVAKECYESALDDDPTLSGTLVLNFTIVGAEEVGGVVEEAEVLAEESTLNNAFVNECMRESVMAVEFVPPSSGGRVDVKYPFIFEPEDAPAQ
jgi:hypothetical protein